MRDHSTNTSKKNTRKTSKEMSESNWCKLMTIRKFWQKSKGKDTLLTEQKRKELSLIQPQKQCKPEDNGMTILVCRKR